MTHQPVGPQAVFAVQHRHQKLPGGHIAPHQHVAVAGMNDVDGGLGDVVSRRCIHHGIGRLVQPQPLQHGHGTGPVAHQHRLHQPLLLRGKNALEHVFAVRTGQDHTHGTGHLGDPL